MANNSNFRGSIVSTTNIRKLNKNINIKISDIVRLAIYQLSYVGEMAVKIARENGNYNDITGNLRSSIGYVVLHNGRPVQSGSTRQYKNGTEGAAASQELLDKLQTKFPWGVVLVVCAGMQYAAYVEAVHHKDVLTSAELKAKRLADKLLKGLTK